MERLHATLLRIRLSLGFGRGLAAPQIGLGIRLVALQLPELPRFLVNPEITWRSPETFTLWDDCLSFPFLMVRLRRHEAIGVRFLDEQGERHELRTQSRAVAELLQHEIDHLDGVLALDHALDREALVSRAVYDQRRGELAAQVDYLIGP